MDVSGGKKTKAQVVDDLFALIKRLEDARFTYEQLVTSCGEYLIENTMPGVSMDNLSFDIERSHEQLFKHLSKLMYELRDELEQSGEATK